PQLGSPIRIDTVSPRAMGAFWRGGTLWLCGTAGTSLNPSHASVFYYAVATNGYPNGTPSLTTSGVIDGGNDVWNYLPAITGNALGDVCLTFTQSSDSLTPRMMGTVMKSGFDGFATPIVLGTSSTYYHGTDTPARWGDFAAASVEG